MAIKSSINLFLFFSLLLFIGCGGNATEDSVVINPEYGEWQDAAIQPIEFERILTIGNDDDFMLPSAYNIIGPVTDPTGNIYFIDEKKGKLYSFDPQGNMRWKTGDVGKGPGDFQNPRGLVTDGKYLYTANIQGSRIDKFNLQGELINSTTLENFDLTFANVEGILADTLLVTASTVWEKIGRKITILNIADTLKKVSQFEVEASTNREVPQGFAFDLNIHIVDTLIATGNIGTYEINLYSIRGEKVKTIARKFEKLMVPGFYSAGNSRSVRSYGDLDPPVNLKNGYFVTTLSWPTNVDDPDQFLRRSRESNGESAQVKYKNAIDLYDAQGTLLYTIESEERTPEIGTIAHIDARGFMYTKSNTPFPQIRKYKVTISPPTTEMDEVLNQ